MKIRLRLVLVLVWAWALLVLVVAVGVTVFVLSGGSAAEQDHRAQVGGALVATMVGVPPALALAWSQRRSPTSAATTAGQAGAAADLLATRMIATWSQQAETQGIRLPAPVRVRWEWAAPQVAVSREEVNAAPPAGTDPLPIPGAQVGDVLSSGLVTRLYDRVYARLRPGRLVVIGGPGAGKTAAMILLLLAALRRRQLATPADRVHMPVPVWLTLGSWNPGTQTLRAWVTATVARDHPYLRAADFGADAIGTLFDSAAVALFLDGLDEMPDPHREQAIRRLQAEASGLRVVLTSRPHEYETTVTAGGQLPAAAVIELQPVGPRAAVDYLLADRTEPARRAWTQLTDRLQAEPGGVLARTLSTPLTLSLARVTHPGDPASLLGPGLDTEQALRHHLLDQTLVTAYPNRRERAHATYWLGWIAHHMNAQPSGPTRDLPWWHISGWIPRWRIGATFGIVVGLVSGLEIGLVGGLVGWLMGGLVSGLVGGLVLGLLLGLVFGLLFGLGDKTAVVSAYRASRRGLRFRFVVGLGAIPTVPRTFVLRRPSRQELWFQIVPSYLGELVSGLVLGLVGGSLLGLVAEIVEVDGLAGGLVDGLRRGLVVGLVFGLVIGLVDGLVGMWSSPVIESVAATARSTYRQDAQTRGVVVLVGGLVYGSVSGVVNGILVGSVEGLVFGFLLGLGGRAVSELLFTEWVLLVSGRRVRFMGLLETALERQVLRQAGAVYQFRHADLQDRLAERFAARS